MARKLTLSANGTVEELAAIGWCAGLAHEDMTARIAQLDAHHRVEMFIAALPRVRAVYRALDLQLAKAPLWTGKGDRRYAPR